MINKNKLSFTLAMPLLMAMAAYFTACNPKPGGEEIKNAGTLKEGRWRGLLHTQGKELPFLFDVEQSGDDYLIYLINAAERIPLDEATFTGDSLHLPMYIFDATLHARLDGNHLEGLWVKNYTDDYRVPFSASHGDSARFTLTSGLQPASFGGKWEVDFISENKIEKALGVFDQQGSYLTGTFLTSTGDYRFLEGVVNGSSMKLSTFDGTHAYLFEGEMNEQGEIAGQFWSGKSWHQRWTAKKNANFELPDPYTLTTVKDRDEVFEINFPDNNGEMVSLSDDKYKGKVVVVQIMGTWRPNCMDETRFLPIGKGVTKTKS
ncbi:MAG: TlpA family protein disulfide reductase [Cyclobacteriaceae bacterium]|nr:TlpA family protein disulfide reductase [Cyclobacteriaceae bacterium]